MSKRLTGMPGMRQAWDERAKLDRRRDEEKAARRAERQRIEDEAGRSSIARWSESLNGRKTTEDERKAAQAAWNADAPARQAAQRDREGFRRHVAEMRSQADRAVESYVTSAQRAALTDDELDQYALAHARAAAMRDLVNRLARADEANAEAARRQLLANPKLARI